MIRPAARADTDLVIDLILELADYEQSRDQVNIDRGRFARQVFDEDAAAALLAFDDATGEAVGLALYFFNFSTWTGGRGVYLEDLFVRPAHRGRGLGRALFRELANVALANDCERIEWAVLDWNEPALAFYRRLGATAMTQWTVHRLAGDPLRKLAET